MDKKVIHKRRPKQADYEQLMKRNGGSLVFGGNEGFRNMLDNIHPKCSVEVETTRQHGDVVDIIRDRYGIPVAVKVHYIEEMPDDTVIEGYDYIAMADITFWEPFDHWVPDENYYDYSEYAENLLANGYVWSDDRCCYYNAETGDEVVW